MENEDKILDSGISAITYDVEEQKIISLGKFIFLSIISFGLYEIWWMYKAWRFFQQKEKLDIMPAGRAIFAIFFLISLFNKIHSFAQEKGYIRTFSSISLFVGFLLVNLLSKLPEPYSLISILSFVFFIPPFEALNYAKRKSTDFMVSEQTSISGRQIVLIVIGVLLWALVILGMTMEDM